MLPDAIGVLSIHAKISSSCVSPYALSRISLVRRQLCSGAPHCSSSSSLHSCAGNTSYLVDAHCPHLMNAAPPASSVIRSSAYQALALHSPPHGPYSNTGAVRTHGAKRMASCRARTIVAARSNARRKRFGTRRRSAHVRSATLMGVIFLESSSPAQPSSRSSDPRAFGCAADASRRSRHRAVVGSSVPPPPRTSIVGSLCACISRSARRAASSPSRLADLADLASSVATPRAPASSPDRARSPVVRHTPRANSRATCAGDARTPGGATRASDALARATASIAACHCAGDCRSRAAVSGDTARGTCCARDSGTPRAIHDAAADAASDPVVARDATRRIIASQPGAEGAAAEV